MQLIVVRQRLELVASMQESARVLASRRWQQEAFRGVVDAGRRTKTEVQRAVHKQMATKRYGLVSASTRGSPKWANLAFEIYGVTGGQRIEEYKGLQVLKSAGGQADSGAVRSGVWNSHRVFQRSFAAKGGFFALLPGGTGKVAPRVLWTYGSKPGQPRDASGRFAPSGKTYGRVRRLFGPSLMKEIVKDEALATFERVGPPLLADKVLSRMNRLLDF